jgi:hypothetical protein
MRRRAFHDASRPLAEALGQTMRVEGNAYLVPSRTTSGHYYEIRIALDGVPICNCPAAGNNIECWHVKYVREEIQMTTETTLVPYEVHPPKSLVPSRDVLASIKETAAMALAGAVALPEGVRTKEQAAALMLYGWELGIPPMTSLQKLFILNGRIAMFAEVMAGLAMKAEPDCRLLVEELTDEVCTMRIQRPSRHISETYTVDWDEIKKAGLARGNNLTYPRDRLRYHCTKRILRIYAPDLINNMEGPVLGGAGEEIYEGAYLDSETGEIHEPAAPERPMTPITDEQRKAIAKVWNPRHHNIEKVRAVNPRAFPQPGAGSNDTKVLSYDEASAVIALLSEKPETPVSASAGVVDAGPPLTTSPACPACDHEYAFNEDTTLLTCLLCGDVQDAPPSEQPAQGALV